jgi:hypothetical protein
MVESAAGPKYSGWQRDPLGEGSLDIVAGGETITKFSGPTPSPNVYEDETTQRYKLGTRLAVDERVFRYARAGAGLNRANTVMNFDSWTLTNEAPNQAAAIGATSIQVVNTTGTADQYQGGWVAIFTTRLQLRHILRNDASDGTDILLYLDGGLEVAIVADSTWVTGYPSIYYDTRSSAENFNSVVGVAPCDVASGSYYWAQTWGPCYARAAGSVPGVSAFDREIYAAGTGALYGGIQAEGATAGGYQRLGFLLPRTSSGGGDQFFMLQLAP